MDASPYAIRWGSWSADSSARLCETFIYVKTNTPATPHAVANEFICARLATLIGLPVAHGIMLHDTSGGPAFASLKFGSGSQRLAPINPRTFVHKAKTLSGEIVAFDCWIANQDRHEKNVCVLRRKAPFRAGFFDHDRALFGLAPGRGRQRLNHVRTRHCIAGCLAEELPTDTGLRTCLAKISKIPDVFIKSICEEARAAQAIDMEEKNAATDFLVSRRDSLAKLLEAAWKDGAFPKCRDFGFL